ncbi:MAG TPA: hypothetical protein VJ397_05170, partial [Thermoplasmata archaeon]|nr:hypothetical protein [Thermoplasmata archaeon]
APMVRLPPPPRLERYKNCPNCLEEVVYTKSLVCQHCGYTLCVPLAGWIGALLLVLAVPLFILWVFGITQINTLPLVGGLLPAIPQDTFLWAGLLLLFLGGVLGYAAAGAIRGQSAKVTARA